MGPFDNDPFNDILEGLFGQGSRVQRRRQFIEGEEEERTVDFIENDGKIYLIFELLGYTKKDVVVIVNGTHLEIRVQKSNGVNMQTYLSQKLRNKLIIRKELPKFINPKKFSHTLKNGILEIIFDKK